MNPPGRQPPDPHGMMPQPIPDPPMPIPALPAGPTGGTVRQWEARVRQLVRQGCTRSEIMSQMAQCNWPFDEALKIVTRIASKERWAAIAAMIATGLFGLFGVAILIAELSFANGQIQGSEFACIIFGIVGFVYGLVRLTKVRA